MITLLLLIGVIIAFLLYSASSWGFILFKFWGWFLLPIFPTVPTITYIQAIGLILVIGLFHTHTSTAIKDEYKDQKTALTNLLLAPWVTLFFGWLVKIVFLS